MTAHISLGSARPWACFQAAECIRSDLLRDVVVEVSVETALQKERVQGCLWEMNIDPNDKRIWWTQKYPR